MGWTKGDLISDAWAMAGIADYEFDLEGGQHDKALRLLDMYMANLNGKGIMLGYPLPGSPTGSNLTDESELPDYAYLAVVSNMSLILANSIGKECQASTRSLAARTYNALSARAKKPPVRDLPANIPAGAGNKAYGTFLTPSEEDTEEIGDFEYAIGQDDDE